MKNYFERTVLVVTLAFALGVNVSLSGGDHGGSDPGLEYFASKVFASHEGGYDLVGTGCYCPWPATTNCACPY